MKTFVVAGISTHKNKTKLRTSNSRNYHSVLKCMGHTNIHLLDLPKPMTKPQCYEYVKKYIKHEFETPTFVGKAPPKIAEPEPEVDTKKDPRIEGRMQQIKRIYPAMSDYHLFKQAELELNINP